MLINEQINASTAADNPSNQEVTDTQQKQQAMQIDTGSQALEKGPDQSEAVTHVQIFLSLIADACKEMIEQMKPLD